YVSSRPFSQIREERRQGRERGIEVLVQHRIRRESAQRPLALFHLVEHALERSGGGGEPGGELRQVGGERVEPRARLLHLGRAQQRVEPLHHPLQRGEGLLRLLHRRAIGDFGERPHAVLRGEQRVVDVARQLGRVQPLVDVADQLVRAGGGARRYLGELLLEVGRAAWRAGACGSRRKDDGEGEREEWLA